MTTLQLRDKYKGVLFLDTVGQEWEFGDYINTLDRDARLWTGHLRILGVLKGDSVLEIYAVDSDGDDEYEGQFLLRYPAKEE